MSLNYIDLARKERLQCCKLLKNSLQNELSTTKERISNIQSEIDIIQSLTNDEFANKYGNLIEDKKKQFGED